MDTALSSAPDVFLGGTCGGNPWRERFCTTLSRRGTSFFDPQVDDWQPWMSDMENACLRSSPLVLFPVLSSTLGLGSLAEVGFSILSIMRSIQAGQQRALVVLIDPTADPSMRITVRHPDGRKTLEHPGPALLAESDRTRALVRSKVAQETWRDGIWLVDDLEAMHETMLRLLDDDSLPIRQKA